MLISYILYLKGFKVVEVALQKIRESIEYVKGLEARKIAFTKCIVQVRGY